MGQSSSPATPPNLKGTLQRFALPFSHTHLDRKVLCCLCWNQNSWNLGCWFSLCVLGFEGERILKIVDFSIGFIVCMLSWLTFSLWRLMRKHVFQNKKSIAHKTVLCASGSGYFFSAGNRLRISGCSENYVFHFLLWPLMRNDWRISGFFFAHKWL